MPGNESLENAWRAYNLQLDVTGKVDLKASFVILVDSAGLTTLLALRAQNILFQAVGGVRFVEVSAGTIGLAAAILLSLGVILPRLKARATALGRERNFIYFGYARHLTAIQVAEALKNDAIPQLADGIVEMARIAWTKHVLAQIAVAVTIASVAVIMAVAFTP
jgi:hypothetical protein